LVFLIIGVSFGLWAIQIFTNEGVLITNITLISMGGVILGMVMMITATILYSIISIAREKK